MIVLVFGRISGVKHLIPPVEVLVVDSGFAVKYSIIPRVVVVVSSASSENPETLYQW